MIITSYFKLLRFLLNLKIIVYLKAKNKKLFNKFKV